jgi:hypothetical protein
LDHEEKRKKKLTGRVEKKSYFRIPARLKDHEA